MRTLSGAAVQEFRECAIGSLVILLGAAGAPGLPVLGLNTATERDALDRAHLYADALGIPERGNQLEENYRSGFADVEHDLAATSIASRKRVLMLNVGPDGRMSAPLGHALVWRRARLVDALAAKQAGTSIDREAVLRVDPDILLLSAGLSPQQLLNRPAWQSVRAVRERRLYRIPPGIAEHTWNIIDLPIYCRWMAEVAYPERMPRRLRAEMRQTYLREFGYRLSEVELDQALAVAENQGTKGYGRFAQEPQDVDPDGEPLVDSDCKSPGVTEARP